MAQPTTPALDASDPTSDWQPASDRGYEIQMDDMGFNPDTNQNLDPLHQTGAVYALASSSQIASKPAPNRKREVPIPRVNQQASRVSEESGPHARNVSGG